jgi:hypothetical protein
MTEPTTFTAVLERWHDFYLLTGTAAVTLLGLLFVALSLHLDVIVHEDGLHLNAVAIEAFMNLLFVLFISMLLLAPTAVGRPLGFALMMLGAFRLLTLLRRIRVIATGGHEALRRKFSVARALIAGVAHVLLATAGWFLFKRAEPETALALLVPALLLMMVVATRGAWDLIMLVGRFKLERGRGTGSGRP